MPGGPPGSGTLHRASGVLSGMARKSEVNVLNRAFVALLTPTAETQLRRVAPVKDNAGGTGLPQTLHEWKGLLIEGTTIISLLTACVVIIVVECFGFRDILHVLQNR